MKKSAVKKRRGRPAKKRGRPAAATGGGGFSVADIQAANSLASRLGAARAKRLLDALG